MKFLSRNRFLIGVLAVFVLVPFVVHAASLGEFIQSISKLLRDSVVGLIFTLGFLYFFWGIVQYLINPEQEKKTKGKEMAVTGLIALTVMFSVYTLVRIIMNTFDLSEDEIVEIPNLPE